MRVLLRSLAVIRTILRLLFLLPRRRLKLWPRWSGFCNLHAFMLPQGPYAKAIKDREEEIQTLFKKVQTMTGLKESDTGSGLAPPTLWDLNADRQRLLQEQPLSVARCTTIIPQSGTTQDEHARPGEGGSGPTAAALPAAAAPAKPAAAPLGGLLAGRLPGAPDAPLSDEGQTKYVISIHQIGEYVVGLGQNVAPTGLPPVSDSTLSLTAFTSPDIEEGMRVGSDGPVRRGLNVLVFRCDQQKFAIQLPLPPKIDPHVTMMTVEDKPDVTYADVGGVKGQLEQLKEVVEMPLLHVCLSLLFVPICSSSFCSRNGLLLLASIRQRVFCCMVHLAPVCCGAAWQSGNTHFG